ncbi:transducin family protein / WD-40 repeat family protein [Striga hermonthica]|uniref:Transducin family protein / WD-40 repeat family protein n=1 Tax=Striga hermonthica TaxID=68872 RepID=A0A9N7R1P9_STRHE|nr:transducin family protein / WD-40 repeat family protein [Striga hermonthica]
MPREKTAMKKVKRVEIWNSFRLLELRRLRMASSSVVLRSRKAREMDLVVWGGAADDEGNDGWHGMISKEEFVRVVEAALVSLGFSDTMLAFYKEMRNKLGFLKPSNKFREHIIEGNWAEASELVGQMDMSDVDRARVLIKIQEQNFRELLKVGRKVDCMSVFYQMTKLGLDEEKTVQLLQLFSNPEHDMPPDRKILLKEVGKLLPPGIILDNRLIELLEQALSHQKESCIYHNTPLKKMSLFRDHLCADNRIPSKLQQVLTRHVHRTRADYDTINALQFSRNGVFLASCAGRDAIIWGVQGLHVSFLRHLTGHGCFIINDICWNTKDTEVLTCAEDGAKRWDVFTGECLSTFNKRGMIRCVWVDDGVFTAHWLGITMWSVYGEELNRWDMKGESWSVRGQDLRGEVKIWEMKGDNLLIPFIGSTLRKEVVYAQEDSTITLLGWETGKVRTVMENGKKVISVALSMDSKFLLVSLDNNTVNLWNIDGRTKHMKMFHDDEMQDIDCGVCFGGCNEAFVACANIDSRVRIWHRSSGELVATLRSIDGGEPERRVAWNPVIPTMLVSGGDDRVIRPTTVTRRIGADEPRPPRRANRARRWTADPDSVTRLPSPAPATNAINPAPQQHHRDAEIPATP